MYRLSYSVFIFLLTFCFSQINNSDIYFLDMGVAIEPKNGGKKGTKLINLLTIYLKKAICDIITILIFYYLNYLVSKNIYYD